MNFDASSHFVGVYENSYESIPVDIVVKQNNLDKIKTLITDEMSIEIIVKGYYLNEVAYENIYVSKSRINFKTYYNKCYVFTDFHDNNEISPLGTYLLFDEEMGNIVLYNDYEFIYAADNNFLDLVKEEIKSWY